MKVTNEYWAGLFDGEGCVSINNRLMPRTSVSQKRPEVLYLLQKTFGGGVYDSGKGNSDWVLTDGEKLQTFLNALLPHLIIKKEEVEIVLLVAKRVKLRNKGYNPLSSEEKQMRLNCRRKLQGVRPQETFEDRPSAEVIRREAIKTAFDYRCCECNKDLKNNPYDSIISKDNKLRCRGCNMKLYKVHNTKIRPIPKEELEKVIAETNSFNEAAEKLGVARCTLYAKRKMYNLR